MTDYLMGYITCSDKEEAELIGWSLVESKLVACANVLPTVRSIYNWENQIQKDNETLLLVKTHKNKTSEIKSYVSEKHSYDNPCIVFYPIVDGSQEYLNWLNNQL